MDSTNQSRYEPLRLALLQRLHELRAELQSGESASLADAAVATHEVSDQKDAADRRQASSIDEAVQRHEQSEVEFVLAALRRLDEGRYGNCQDCDEPISPQRLQVQPAALRCAACQTTWERRAPAMHPTP
jgi:DnaK suppressor protein